MSYPQSLSECILLNPIASFHAIHVRLVALVDVTSLTDTLTHYRAIRALDKRVPPVTMSLFSFGKQKPTNIVS
jgi:hypothetical protein